MSKRRDAGGVQHSTGARRPKDEPSILEKAAYYDKWQALKKSLQEMPDELEPITVESMLADMESYE